MKHLWKIGLAFFLAGIILLCSGFAVAGFHLQNLSGIKYTEKYFDSSDGFNKISFNTKNTDINLEPSTDGKIHITYFESKYEKYSITKNGGSLEFQLNDTHDFFHVYWLDFLFRPHSITIQLPNNVVTNLNLSTTNGKIHAGNVVLKRSDNTSIQLNTINGEISVSNFHSIENISCQTTNGGITAENMLNKSLTLITSNSKISANNCSAENEISCKTTNGGINITNTAAGTIEIDTSNGGIRFDHANANSSFRCKTTNGSITGTILGKMSAYNITSSTTNGSNNLPNYNFGSKELTLLTTNGNINVDFSKK
ncbi:MAG: DUF4097 family beta strand repeat-containing protein [Bacillota bacterium]|nr:DUF4097 family beta strand repeat-containing protein [Bacillota bacterium]